MTAQTIQVFIDPAQLAAQKRHGYSLYLAKMVNGAFTVVWQSRGAVATSHSPSYEYSNIFDISIPFYNINYSKSTLTPRLAFTSCGYNQPINLGKTINLDRDGRFGMIGKGTAGAITINNFLQGNSHEILLDSLGHAVFVNTAKGLDIGATTLTPTDTYRIWFGSYQAAGTIIANNSGNAGIVTFKGETVQTISYDSAGVWTPGPLTAQKPFRSTNKAGRLLTGSAQLYKSQWSLLFSHIPHR